MPSASCVQTEVLAISQMRVQLPLLRVYAYLDMALARVASVGCALPTLLVLVATKTSASPALLVLRAHQELPARRSVCQ